MIKLMKKIAFISAISTYLLAAATTFAQITITQPKTSAGTVGYPTIEKFVNAALTLSFVLALILVLAMMVWGAIQWILSGGDKEAVGAARERIIHALIGLAILAMAFAIVQLAGTFFGVNLLGPLPIPTPGTPSPVFSTPAP